MAVLLGAVKSSINVNKLDPYEKMVFMRLIKTVPEEKAVQIIVNDVEGDFTQLSKELQKYAKKHNIGRVKL